MNVRRAVWLLLTRLALTRDLSGPVTVNFIDFVVAPLFAVATRLLPDLQPLFLQLHANREHFSARYASESDDSGEQAKMSSRSSAFVEKYRAVLGENASPSPEAAASLAAAASRRVEGGEDGVRRATWAVYRLTDDERG